MCVCVRGILLCTCRHQCFTHLALIKYHCLDLQTYFRLQTKEGTTLKVEAKPFQSKSLAGLTQNAGSIDFQLLDQTNQVSSIFSIKSNGEVEALRSLDYETSPRYYTLTVVGREKTTGYNSSAKVGCSREFAFIFSWLNRNQWWKKCWVCCLSLKMSLLRQWLPLEILMPSL